MRFLSLFDGCHMFGLALRNVGAECIGVSEIEEHPRAVTRYHYPATVQLGDVQGVTAADVGPVDLIVGGWPCQGNSVAGDRGGLDDPRSGLFGEVVRLARETSARWLLLENVPGAMSVNERRDWAAILGALDELGYGLAWRVLDAQYAGVPQRRRRVFVVGRLGNVSGPAEVLFEPESEPGHSPAGRAARARVARESAPGAGEGGRGTRRVAPTLVAGGRPYPGMGVDSPESVQVVAACLTASTHKTDENSAVGHHLVPHSAQGDVATSLLATGVDQDDGTFIEHRPVVVDLAQITNPDNRSSADPRSPAPTLAATGRPAVYNCRGDDFGRSTDTAPCLDADRSGSIEVGVRRLTPRECERLQGLPDDWTRYGRREDGSTYEVADGARYAMIGNGGAVPVVRWIAGRMLEVDAGSRVLSEHAAAESRRDAR